MTASLISSKKQTRLSGGKAYPQSMEKAGESHPESFCVSIVLPTDSMPPASPMERFGIWAFPSVAKRPKL